MGHLQHERRSRPRIPARIVGKIHHAAREAISLEVSNISNSGILCRVPHHVTPFTQLKVALILPVQKVSKTENEWVEMDGVVVRSTPDRTSTSGHHELAVFFLNMPDASRLALDAFIRQHEPGKPIKGLSDQSE